MDRDTVPGMRQRLGGPKNGAPDVKAIVAPPYLNARPPLYEDGDVSAGKYDTVSGWAQTDTKLPDGTWVKNEDCPRSKIWVVYENGRAYPDYLLRYYRGRRDPRRTPFASKRDVPAAQLRAPNAPSVVRRLPAPEGMPPQRQPAQQQRQPQDVQPRAGGMAKAAAMRITPTPAQAAQAHRYQQPHPQPQPQPQPQQPAVQVQAVRRLTPTNTNPPAARKPPAVRLVRAVRPWESPQPDGLSFAKGDLLMVLSDDPGRGWATGTCDGVRGVYPTSYVEPASFRKSS